MIHRFNDIDHITPIVYRIAKDTNEKIMVLCLNPFYDLSSDFRLRFLREKHHVCVDYLYSIYNPSIFYKILSHFLFTSYVGGSFKKNIMILFGRFKGGHQSRETICYELNHLAFGFVRSLIMSLKIIKLNNKFFMNYYGEKWVEGMINSFKPSVLVFDHAATNRIYNVRALMDVSKRRVIPTISLPHGIPLFLEHPSGYDKTKQDFINNGCDYLVLQHRRWSDECIRFGLYPDRPTILGLVRYCKEWKNVLKEIVTPDKSLKDLGNGKLKVVYMDTGPNRFSQYIFAQEAIKKIGELDFVHLLYKPHTRRNRAHLQLPISVELVTDVNSVNLIKWADVVIGMQSSIMIEALVQDKIYISPTYFRDRKLIYEEYGACWMVNSHEELEEALKKLNEDVSFRPYSSENVERFLTDIVYDGERDKDVLGVYKQFILAIAKEKKELQRRVVIANRK